MRADPQASESPFTPAAGYHWLTPLYDVAIAALTREQRWRSALVSQIRPQSDDVIADVGCGTGSLLVRLGKTAPSAMLIGIDPDPSILDRARAKVKSAGLHVDFLQGFAHEAAALLEGRAITKIVSSLVFHQTPLTEKAQGLRAFFEALRPRGEVHIADYGLQRSRLMRMLFRAGVQNLDGRANTAPNARGVLPELMHATGFVCIEETTVIPTLTGSLSLYRAVKQ